METYSKKIDELVQRIVEEVRPLRIILFGSASRGKIGPDSDIDLLVVMPGGVHRRQVAGGADPFRHLVNITNGEKKATLTIHNDFGNAADPCGHNRHFAGHGF